MKLFRSILQFFKNLFGLKDKQPDRRHIVKSKRPASKRLDYVEMQVDDLPELHEIKERIIYIVGENGYHWVAAFKCPCGCGDLIQLNLLKEAIPFWNILFQEEELITIYPSIERKIGCKSHFNLTKGQITWWSTNDF